jgi:hypothetical protein
MLYLLLACSKGGSGDSIVDAPDYVCVDVAQADGTSASGISYCSVDDDTFGYMNRESAMPCAGDPEDTVPACPDSHHSGCAKDSDCGPGQVCGASAMFDASCQCYTVCASDAMCGADEACFCAVEPIQFDGSAHSAGAIDQCLPGNCRTGADCASGECGASPDVCDDGPVAGLYCRTADDECRIDADCPFGRCEYVSSLARWACSKGAICD